MDALYQQVLDTLDAVSSFMPASILPSMMPDAKCVICDGCFIVFPATTDNRLWTYHRGLVFDRGNPNIAFISGVSPVETPLDRCPNLPRRRRDDMRKYPSMYGFYPPMLRASCLSFTTMRSSSPSQQYNCHLAHPICWDLLEKILGRFSDEEAPDLVAAIAQLSALKKERRQLLRDTKDKSMREMLRQDDIKGFTVALRQEPLSIPQISQGIRKAKLRKPSQPRKPTKRRRRNPFAKRRKHTKKEPEIKAVEEPVQKVQEVQVQHVPSTLDIFPYELRCMILRHLGGRDVQNVISALGWSLEPSFWRSKIRQDIFFAVQKLDKDNFNWQKLCCALDSMLDRPGPALSTRIIILNRVYELQEQYNIVRERKAQLHVEDEQTN